MAEPGSPTTPSEMTTLLSRQRAALRDDGPATAEARVDRLARAIALLLENQAAIVDAAEADFGCRAAPQTRMGDVYASLESLKFARDRLERWMRPEKRKVSFPLNLLGARARVVYQAKGVVGIIGTWNFPVNTVFAPLAGVLAAGNRAIVKFSEISPRTASLMEGLVSKRFAETEVACVSGGADVGAALSALPLDHLVFTGSTAIGREVMRAAATNLTPVTLELGGKSPVILARDADLELAAVRIMTGKALNVGQACLAPDYVMVPDELLEAFVGHATRWTERMFPTIVENRDFTSIVDARHHARLRAYLDEARARKVDVRAIDPAEERFDLQAGAHKMPMTLVIDPPEDLRIMQEEIFGPILVLKRYRQLDECIAYIAERPRPLGLYLFSNDPDTRRRVLDRTMSGGVTINDVLTHVSAEDLPFGGIGASGIGRYHGHDGFREFSHARPVFEQSRVNLQRLSGMVPPYGEACEKNLGRIIRD